MRSLIVALTVALATVSSIQAQTNGTQYCDLSSVLQSAGSRAAIGGVECRLEVEAWLNYMPPLPKTGAPLYARVTIDALQAPLPRGLKITGVWIVVPGGGVPPSGDLRHQPQDTPGRLQTIAVFDRPPDTGAGTRVGVALYVDGSTAFLATNLSKVDHAY